MHDNATRYEPYGRFWAVYENDTLVCVAVYKKGARAVLKRLTETAAATSPVVEPAVPATR